MTWTPDNPSKHNVDRFLADVLTYMRRTRKPFGKAAAAVLRDAKRLVSTRVVEQALSASVVEDLV